MVSLKGLTVEQYETLRLLASRSYTPAVMVESETTVNELIAKGYAACWGEYEPEGYIATHRGEALLAN